MFELIFHFAAGLLITLNPEIPNAMVLIPTKEMILKIRSAEDFDQAAMAVFRFQVKYVPVYRDFVYGLPERFRQPQHFSEIPFLPVTFFKSCRVFVSGQDPETVFLSSGTTGAVRSRHFIADLSWYTRIFTAGFEEFYGPPADYCILALLPSYLEQEDSSLVYMAGKLIERSGHSLSGFYLNDYRKLHRTLLKLKQQKQQTMLLGVTYALLDFADSFPQDLPELTLVETGGMKGRRREMVREEVHEILKGAFSLEHIHSEYGMTELLSQAWSTGEGRFRCPPWVKVLVRDTNDPFAPAGHGRTGGINIIDLANLYSCAFIATQDLGKLHPDGSFEVLGRFDNSDIRGCNLLVE